MRASEGEGKELGKIQDFRFDERTGAFVGPEAESTIQKA